MLRDALAKLRAEPGPDAWIQTLFTMEAACRVARTVGDWTLAAELAQQMRQFDPAYAGTHYALAQAAQHQGNFGVALAEYSAAAKAWRAADPDLAEAADARRQIATLTKPSVPTKN